jgi:prepilin-type N-terminal cleavage/methylation domain-containing protein
MSRRTRPGFKLIELLIVIAILGALAGLILPAVLKIRADDARTQTHNRLRECAAAIHAYHGVNNKFPDAAWTGGIYKDDARSMWFHLLPFVGQKDAYDRNVHDAIVPAYLTSGDPSRWVDAGRIDFAGNIRLFGYNTLTAKKANGAVGAECKPSGLSLAADLTGSMSSGLTLARIPDGTSNTFMLATRYAECGSPSYSTCYSASPIGTILADGGETPSTGVPTGNVKGAFFGAGSHHLPPRALSRNSMFQVAPTREQCLPDDAVFGHAFSPRGLSTALADATVRLNDPSMSPSNFCWGLCPSEGCNCPWGCDGWDQ